MKNTLTKTDTLVPVSDSTDNVYSKDVIGNKSDAASTTVNTTTSLIRYIKGLLGLHPVPTADVATNTSMRDVIGNKTDTTGGTSLVALVKVVDGVADGIQTDLSNATDGLGALKALIDTVDTNVDSVVANKPIPVSKALTLDADAAEKVFNCFTITGAVEITRLYGVLTNATTLTNATVVGFRVVDNVGHGHLDAEDGVLSALPVGTVVACLNGASGTSTAVLSSAAANIVTLGFSSFFLIKKTAQITYLSFAYTTTDNPSAAAMTVYAEYRALSSDGALTAV